MYKVLHNGNDITAYVSNLSLKDNIEAISTELTFAIPFNPRDRYLNAPKIEPGDKVRFVNDSRELFSGIIINTDIDGGVTAYDYGFYLNKQEVIFQTAKTSVSDAIRALCEKCGVPVGSIVSIPTKVTKAWLGNTPDSIIKEMLESATAEQAKNYLYRVENGVFNVREYPKTAIIAKYKQTAGKSFDVTTALGQVSGSKSIDGLRNKVTAVNGSESSYTILATQEDKNSQAKYGTLGTVINIDDDNKANAKTIAKNKLRELNVVTSEYAVSDMLGSDDVKSGVILNFSSFAYGIVGLYLVTEVTHTYTTNEEARHRMSLSIKKVVSV